MRILIFFIIVSFYMNTYAEEEIFRDPFDDVLPEEPVKKEDVEVSDIIMPPQISIEGVLWDTDKPQAIIDGEVYKIGDNIKNQETKLLTIEGNVVFISYKGKVFKFTTEKK